MPLDGVKQHRRTGLIIFIMKMLKSYIGDSSRTIYSTAVHLGSGSDPENNHSLYRCDNTIFRFVFSIILWIRVELSAGVCIRC